MITFLRLSEDRKENSAKCLEAFRAIGTIDHRACLPPIAAEWERPEPHFPFYATERMEMTLKDVFARLRKKDTPDFWDDTVKSLICVGLASALEYVHRREITLGGLTPKNILLDKQHRPLLCGYTFTRFMKDEKKKDGPRGQRVGDSTPEKDYVITFAFIVYNVITGIGVTALDNLPRALERVENEAYRDLISQCWNPVAADRPTFKSLWENRERFKLPGCDPEAFDRYCTDLATPQKPAEVA
jgi:serine/threonine protein kinase